MFRSQDFAKRARLLRFLQPLSRLPSRTDELDRLLNKSGAGPIFGQL